MYLYMKDEIEAYMQYWQIPYNLTTQLRFTFYKITVEVSFLKST